MPNDQCRRMIQTRKHAPRPHANKSNDELLALAFDTRALGRRCSDVDGREPIHIDPNQRLTVDLQRRAEPVFNLRGRPSMDLYR
jgi:hypothetical protein